MPGRALIVVPDSDRVEQWLLDASRQADFIDARGICTVGQLVERCEPARWSGKSPADPLLVRMLIATHAAAVAERSFGLVARTPEFAAHVHEVLSHLRAQGSTPRALHQAASLADEGLAARSRALATLWERLDDALATRGLVDAGELVRLAAQRLTDEGLPPRLRGHSAIEIHHVHDLFPSRLSLFEALAQACQRAQVRFSVWWPSSGHAQTDVFVLDAVRTMEARWQALDAEAFPETPNMPLSWVGSVAFADDAQGSPAPALEAFCAPTPCDEVRLLASRVKDCIDRGTPPEAIAIAFRDLADDTEALVEALAELDIPARGRLGVPLLATPPVRLAVGLFNLLEDGFPAAATAELLESRYVRVLPRDSALPRRAFAEAGLRDDVIGALEKRGAYEVRLSELERRTRGEADRGAYARLRNSVSEVLRTVRSIPEEASAVELLEAWWDSLSRLGLFKTLSELPEPRNDASRLLGHSIDLALARDQAAAESLLNLLTSLKHSLVSSGLGTRRMTRKDFSRHVRRAAQDLNVMARGPRAGAVWLLDARELAGRHFEVLFFGGLVDGRFPGRPAPLPLLSEDERATLNRLSKTQLFRLSVLDGGVRLPLRLAEDRLLFHFVLSAAERVVVSRSRLDGAGRELLSSPFRDALIRVVSDFREAQIARVPTPALDEVRSESDLRARVALELLCPPQTRQTARDARSAGLAQVFGAEPWLLEAAQVSAAERERLLFFSDAERPTSPFTGQLEGPVRDAVSAHFDFSATNPVSAAQLNVWGQCAFRGLALYVLDLSTVDAAGEEPDARARGSFLHDVLKELVPELDRRGVLGASEASEQTLRDLVDGAVALAAKSLEARSPTGHPALWELSRSRTATIIRRLVSKREAIRPFQTSKVLGVELEFGSPRGAIAELREVAVRAAFDGERDVYVTGRIDRIDAGDGVAGVIDYKTSVAQPRALLESLLTSDFQLPFYLLAVKQWHPQRRLDAVWVGMRQREARSLMSLVKGEQGIDALLALDATGRQEAHDSGRFNVANAVHSLLGRLRKGNVSPRPTTCRYCELKPVCRISQRRMFVEAD